MTVGRGGVCDLIHAQVGTVALSGTVGHQRVTARTWVPVNTGLADPASTSIAKIFFELSPIEDRDRPSPEIIDAIRVAAGDLSEVDVLLTLFELLTILLALLGLDVRTPFVTPSI